MNETQINEGLSLIKKSLSLNINDATNGNELVQVLENAMSLQGLSADCMVWSESLLTREVASIIEGGKYVDYPANDRKHLIQRDCAKYTELFNRSEKYNKELHYRIEGLRTLISNAKEIMRAGI